MAVKLPAKPTQHNERRTSVDNLFVIGVRDAAVRKQCYCCDNCREIAVHCADTATSNTVSILTAGETGKIMMMMMNTEAGSCVAPGWQRGERIVNALRANNRRSVFSNNYVISETYHVQPFGNYYAIRDSETFQNVLWL